MSILVAILLWSQVTMAKDFAAGFNQGWIANKYGTQWVEGFNANEFERMMILTKQANGNILRFWLFEGYSSTALLFNQNTFIGLNPQFVTNLKQVLAAAKRQNIQLNLTLFDGNIGNGPAQTIEQKNMFWNLLNNKYNVRQDFLNNAFVPLLQIISAPEYQGVVTQLDIVNEINALVRSRSNVRFEQGWGEANKFICDFYQVKQSISPATQMTVSLGWGDPISLITSQTFWPNCVDFFDIHLYNSSGTISDDWSFSSNQCKTVRAYAHGMGKKIQLGEFGQSGSSLDDNKQSSVTRNFITNAYNCGLDGAMAWRLSEVEDSAYLAYERQGVLRPGYYVFQQTLQQLGL